jgi:hypothetical protein
MGEEEQVCYIAWKAGLGSFYRLHGTDRFDPTFCVLLTVMYIWFFILRLFLSKRTKRQTRVRMDIPSACIHIFIYTHILIVTSSVLFELLVWSFVNDAMGV